MKDLEKRCRLRYNRHGRLQGVRPRFACNADGNCSGVRRSFRWTAMGGSGASDPGSPTLMAETGARLFSAGRPRTNNRLQGLHRPWLKREHR
jgi:hypothetical protein